MPHHPHALVYFINTEHLILWSRSGSHWRSRTYRAVSGGGRGVYIRDSIVSPYGQALPGGYHTRWGDDRDYSKAESKEITSRRGPVLSDRGGPIPPGVYWVEKPTHHPSLGYSARLRPDHATKALLHELNRGGFFIHGRGPRGSDGCIVPLETKIKPFLDKVETLREALGNHLALKVIPGKKVVREWAVGGPHASTISS